MIKFVVAGEIAITDKEFRNLRRRKVCYKLFKGQWYKLTRKQGNHTKIGKLQIRIKLLRDKINKLKEGRKHGKHETN